MNQNQQSSQPGSPSRMGGFVQLSVPTLPSWQSNKALNSLPAVAGIRRYAAHPLARRYATKRDLSLGMSFKSLLSAMLGRRFYAQGPCTSLERENLIATESNSP